MARRTPFIERYEKIREAILATRDFASRAEHVGRRREAQAELALAALEAAGHITGFISTGRFGIRDVMDGIDFYVSYIREGKRVSLPIGVAGPRSLKKDRKKHPQVAVLVVLLGDDVQTVKEKILDLLY